MSPAPDPPLPEGRWIEAGGVRTRYHEAGQGEPIVFIYGGNFGTADSASSAYTWNVNLAPLAARFRAIAFDKVGQGHTDNPPGDDYTMAAVVRHAAAFIEALKLPPVHLVGHSRGGFAAMRLALEQQHLIRSLTIVNSGTLSPRVGTNDVVLAQPPHPSYTRECARWVYENYCHDRAIVTEAWIDAVMEVLALPKYRASVDKMEKEGLKTSRFLPALARDKRETLAWLAEGCLQRPVQFVWGANDRTAAVEGARDLFEMAAAHERRALLHVVNHSGHFPFREHPERFNALLANFAAWASA
ncbi:MAG TPA: alpha/beta hydrolase [Alphaproteobacteria bacterium]